MTRRNALRAQRDPQSAGTADLCGLPFRLGTVDHLVAAVAASPMPVHVHFLNAYSIAQADSDGRLHGALAADGSVNIADGWPVRNAISKRGFDVDRVRGADYMRHFFESGPRVRHYLLGSTDEILSALRAALTSRYPDAQIAGSHSPPFGEWTGLELQAIDDRLDAARPDVVWVGLGTPKQDFEAARLAERGYTAVAVGAAFEFVSGSRREAHPVIQRLRLEWLSRVVSEPRRLWRRYVFGYPRFRLACRLDPHASGTETTAR